MNTSAGQRSAVQCSATQCGFETMGEKIGRKDGGRDVCGAVLSVFSPRAEKNKKNKKKKLAKDCDQQLPFKSPKKKKKKKKKTSRSHGERR